MQKLSLRFHAHGPIRTRGFSLVEIAVSLAIMAMILGAMIVPMITQVQQRNVSATEKTISEVRDALLGFAALNGRLPCPAVGNATGVEAFATGGSSANGACASFWGFVPGITLGLNPIDSDGYVVDAWGTRQNRIRYAVSNETVTTVTPNITNPFTTTDGMRRATLPELGRSTYVLLTVCDSGLGVQAGVSCNTAKTLTNRAVAVIWSTGANAATAGTGVDEAQNPNANNETSADRLFVNHVASDNATNPFDDVVTWLSLNTLTNRMISAGMLP